MPMYADDQDLCPEKFVTLRVTELEALHKRIEELEADRDARPVARWEKIADTCENYKYGRAIVGCIEFDTSWRGYVGAGRWLGPFPIPEAAKAAVEEALRGLSAKTEGA